MKTALDILNEKNREMITITPETTVYEAAKVMVENHIGSVIIKEGDTLHGIFTERDFLKNSLQDGFDSKTAKVKDYMTCNLIFVMWDDPVYKLQDMMLGKRVRHLLVEKDGKYIGLLSIGDVTKAGLNETQAHLKSVSWNYYEDWKWKKK
jgi:CBS domain-containing protein